MNKLDEFRDDIKSYLPKYLGDDKVHLLISKIFKFPDNIDQMYSQRYQTFWMQGDAFKDIASPDFENGKYSTEICKAMIISNTCDIAIDNPRKYYTPALTMVPLIDLKAYKQCLLEDGHAVSEVEQHIKDIKNQLITSILYLPPDDNNHEYFARLDCSFHIPTEALNDKDREIMLNNRIFSLSNYGFYLLLLKLSIHFTRIQERIDRDINPEEMLLT